MNYKEIEIEWMKELLKDKEKEIIKLKERVSKQQDLIRYYRKEVAKLKKEQEK